MAILRPEANSALILGSTVTIEWQPVIVKRDPEPDVEADGYVLFVFYEGLIPNNPALHPVDSSIAQYRAHVEQRPPEPDNYYWSTPNNTRARNWEVKALCQHGAGGILIVPTLNGVAVPGDQEQYLSFLPNVQTSINEAVAAEKSDRELADAELRTRIGKETVDRESADAELRTSINEAVAAEKSERELADAALASKADHGARIVQRRVTIDRGMQSIDYVLQTPRWGPLYLIPPGASLTAVWYGFVDPISVPSLAAIDVRISTEKTRTVVVDCSVIGGAAFPEFSIDVFAAWDWDYDSAPTPVLRFKTGQQAPMDGLYAFDGYATDRSAAQPTEEERIIPLSKGETFPPIRSTSQGAWWRPAGP